MGCALVGLASATSCGEETAARLHCAPKIARVEENASLSRQQAKSRLVKPSVHVSKGGMVLIVPCLSARNLATATAFASTGRVPASRAMKDFPVERKYTRCNADALTAVPIIA